MLQKTIWEKIAKASNLTPIEAMQFAEFGHRLERVEQTVNTWAVTGTNKIDGGHLARNPYTNLAYVYKNTDVTLTNTITTPIEWDGLFVPGCVAWDSAFPDRLYPVGVGETEFYALGGKVTFAANGTGRRGAHVDFYDSDDNQILGHTLFSQPATGVEPDTYPFFFVTSYDPETRGSYFKFSVVQTSGGDLDVQYTALSIFKLHAGQGT